MTFICDSSATTSNIITSIMCCAIISNIGINNIDNDIGNMLYAHNGDGCQCVADAAAAISFYLYIYIYVLEL